MARLPLFAFLSLLCLLAGPVVALEPENLLLLVNRNVPESRQLAEAYAKARGVPEGRIHALDLPAGTDAKGEEMTFAAFERDVVPVLRDHLRQNKLDQTVTCIVTFYGLPLRIGAHVPTPAEQQEVADLKAAKANDIQQIQSTVEAMEKQALVADKTFRVPPGRDLAALARRSEQVMIALARSAGAANREAISAVLSDSFQKLYGSAGLLRKVATAKDLSVTPTQRAAYDKMAQDLRAKQQLVAQMQERRYDPEARMQMRQAIGDGFGLFDHVRIIDAHMEYLDGQNSDAAFDSELALLWWDYYPRPQSQINPLHYRAKGRFPRLVMVSRLDAPQAATVQAMIDTSIKVEQAGLTGRVVLDSRGIAAAGDDAKPGAMGWYDQGIRNLGQFLKAKTILPLTTDDASALLLPKSSKGVALYCGWYSLRNFVNCCEFQPGAVGYHVASFELVSLHTPGEKGWVAGLLNSGVVATIGPVAEPYLHAFPPADEFFPLLLTGKMTLAECYWRTVPQASWMMCLIGDPLYNPWKAKPLLKREDLPLSLRAALDPPAAATRPAE